MKNPYNTNDFDYWQYIYSDKLEILYSIFINNIKKEYNINAKQIYMAYPTFKKFIFDSSSKNIDLYI